MRKTYETKRCEVFSRAHIHLVRVKVSVQPVRGDVLQKALDDLMGRGIQQSICKDTACKRLGL
jgi:hypothetical protein